MRLCAAAVVLTLTTALAGCDSTQSVVKTCGELRFDHPVMVLEGVYAEPTSALARLGKDGCFDEVSDISLPGNSALFNASGRPFVVDQDQGILYALSTSKLGITKTFTTTQNAEARSNPHGIDVDANGRLWVARYGLGSLAILNADGSRAGTVDLSDLDPDGVPEQEAVAIDNGRAYVALQFQDLTRLQTRRPGALAMIDVAPPYKRLGTLDLIGSNPFGSLVRATKEDSTLLIATPGSFSTMDERDGIDAIDLTTGTARQLISEMELGGSATAIVIASDTEAYAIVLGTEVSNPTKVVRFDPSTGKVIRVLSTAPSFSNAGLAINGEFVLVTDFISAKIHVFSRATYAFAGDITAKLKAPWSLFTLDNE